MNLEQTLRTILGTEELRLLPGQQSQCCHFGTLFSIPGEFANLQFTATTGLGEWTVMLQAGIILPALLYSFSKADAFPVNLFKCHAIPLWRSFHLNPYKPCGAV